ncbi:hypothetical protein JCM16303_007003 [Sporobolomyces ruberrimus]
MSSQRPSRKGEAPSSSDESSSLFEADNNEKASPVPKDLPLRDPLWGLRRTNTIVGLLGGGCLSIGSCLVIALYVTGPPRLDDLATSVTEILFLMLVGGCAACVPSWVAAGIVLFGAKPTPDAYPPHAKLLRLLCLIATLIATIYTILAIVLYVLLQEKESFVDFCLLNVSKMSEEACTARWNRNWLIILGVGLVLLYHIAFGFPLYRYTRGPQGGTQIKEGFLLELSHRDGEAGEEEEERKRRSQWSSESESSDSELERKRRRSIRREKRARRKIEDEEW